MSEQGAVVHLAYTWMIVAYFFFGGLSAGTFLFSVAANYWRQEFRHLAKKSAVASLIALCAGMLILILDLGQPFRVWRLFITSNMRSPVVWGVWILNVFLVMNLIYTALLFLGKDKIAKKFAYIGCPFAVLAATYTAMLLAHSPAKLLWHTSLLPVLFLNGAIISGLALVMLFSAGSRNTKILSGLGKFTACLIILELGMILGEVTILLTGGTESVATAKALFSGQLGFLFLGVEIVLGSVIPVVMLLRSKATALTQATASLLILIGIFTMRYVIVVGGQLIN